MSYRGCTDPLSRNSLSSSGVQQESGSPESIANSTSTSTSTSPSPQKVKKSKTPFSPTTLRLSSIPASSTLQTQKEHKSETPRKIVGMFQNLSLSNQEGSYGRSKQSTKITRSSSARSSEEPQYKRSRRSSQSEGTQFKETFLQESKKTPSIAPIIEKDILIAIHEQNRTTAIALLRTLPLEQLIPFRNRLLELYPSVSPGSTLRSSRLEIIHEEEQREDQIESLIADIAIFIKELHLIKHIEEDGEHTKTIHYGLFFNNESIIPTKTLFTILNKRISFLRKQDEVLHDKIFRILRFYKKWLKNNIGCHVLTKKISKIFDNNIAFFIKINFEDNQQHHITYGSIFLKILVLKVISHLELQKPDHSKAQQFLTSYISYLENNPFLCLDHIITTTIKKNIAQLTCYMQRLQPISSKYPIYQNYIFQICKYQIQNLWFLKDHVAILNIFRLCEEYLQKKSSPISPEITESIYKLIEEITPYLNGTPSSNAALSQDMSTEYRSIIQSCTNLLKTSTHFSLKLPLTSASFTPHQRIVLDFHTLQQCFILNHYNSNGKMEIITQITHDLLLKQKKLYKKLTPNDLISGKFIRQSNHLPKYRQFQNNLSDFVVDEVLRHTKPKEQLATIYLFFEIYKKSMLVHDMATGYAIASALRQPRLDGVKNHGKLEKINEELTNTFFEQLNNYVSLRKRMEEKTVPYIPCIAPYIKDVKSIQEVSSCGAKEDEEYNLDAMKHTGIALFKAFSQQNFPTPEEDYITNSTFLIKKYTRMNSTDRDILSKRK